ncbi:hypothetical protein CEXT_168131 [Caerostris extrusa]|uniref:Uncharacterized protein n=1 Tax=Caerostris extrusa TaxID=172846 RepID=A0AAV4PMY0_CAEEX|nr:hypothetical protein CEXT_168131 [Caerostris extrusa]
MDSICGSYSRSNIRNLRLCINIKGFDSTLLCQVSGPYQIHFATNLFLNLRQLNLNDVYTSGRSTIYGIPLRLLSGLFEIFEWRWFKKERAIMDGYKIMLMYSVLPRYYAICSILSLFKPVRSNHYLENTRATL